MITYTVWDYVTICGIAICGGLLFQVITRYRNRKLTQFRLTSLPNNDKLRLDSRKRQRLLRLARDVWDDNVRVPMTSLMVTKTDAGSPEDFEIDQLAKAKAFLPTEPRYQFTELFVNEQTSKQLQWAKDAILDDEQKLGSDTTEKPFALHFWGPAGTGKTMAAHAMAAVLKKRIITITPNTFYGELIVEWQKKVRAAFLAAMQDNAVLFIDNADDLLSTNAAQTIATQIRTSLEQFQGVVIFATHTINNYNTAFESWVRHIHFTLPDTTTYVKLWEAKLTTLPLAPDVTATILAQKIEGISGREIDEVVGNLRAILNKDGKTQLDLKDFMDVVAVIKQTRFHDDNDRLPNVFTRKQFEVTDPIDSGKELIVATEILEKLQLAQTRIEHAPTLFDAWNLRAIEPFTGTALNFHGPPGTGKTLAAHWLAKRLKRPILIVNYGDIAGQLVGDAERNIDIIFRTAARENAVLFIDEADTLLARRLTSVTQAQDVWVNSLSNQVLINVELFRGVVIFATNMFQNLDKAFETRISYIKFTNPDEPTRQRLWDMHLALPGAAFPRAADIDTTALAKDVPGVCGRDIKNAVLNAAAKVVMDGRTLITQTDLLYAINQILQARIEQDGEPMVVHMSTDQTDFLARLRKRLPATSEDPA